MIAHHQYIAVTQYGGLALALSDGEGRALAVLVIDHFAEELQAGEKHGLHRAMVDQTQRGRVRRMRVQHGPGRLVVPMDWRMQAEGRQFHGALSLHDVAVEIAQ